MKTRTNKVMEQTLAKREYDFTKHTVTLPTELQKLLDSGFRIEQSCILLKDFKYFGSNNLDSDFKKTEYEDFVNDIHIDNYMSNVPDEFEYLKTGLEVGKRIHKKLKESFGTNFRITIAFNETEYTGEEVETYGSCVVKFYSVRPGCDDKFRVDNLDEYKTEGVLVIE